jgi:hypothetical protein
MVSMNIDKKLLLRKIKKKNPFRDSVFLRRHFVLGSHYLARWCVFLILVHVPVLCSRRSETKDPVTNTYSEREQRFQIHSKCLACPSLINIYCFYNDSFH